MNIENSFDKEDRILRLREVEKIIGLSRATIYRLIASGDFPKQIHLTTKTVGWRLSSIEKWVMSRE